MFSPIRFNGVSTQQVQCQEFGSCNFYSYDEGNNQCLLFSTCSELSDQECNTCTTSEVGCLVNNGTETKAQLLMVFGGEPYSNNVTLLSLDGDPPVPDCLQNLNPHPKQLSGSCSATLRNSKLCNSHGKPICNSSCCQHFLT